jgi:D-glycerate 3-kinase
MKKAEQFIDQLIQQQALPLNYKDLVGDYLWPLVQDMAELYTRRTKTETNTTSVTPWLVGLQGTQGSGKSTVCLFIKALLEKCFELNVVVLSIDDFYKTRKERIKLAATIHPLLVTRGVPGTHDVDLAIKTINKLSNLTDGESCSVPSFNKKFDDRVDESDWPVISNKVDIILFEGWCMGVPAQSETALIHPINELEKKEDRDTQWRGYVNNKLKSEYHDLFSKIENLIVLQAPSFKCVYQWRLLQEKKLELKSDNKNNNKTSHIQTPEQVERFISHYERLTRHALNILPEEASWVIKLDDKHNMKSLFRNNNSVRLG